ncbi:class I adenylate-forming enzyme family protein [uncultured Jatrophihabitans sp.]|uniref:class I adenylate-forming enzyme family protein n=1 Tax=uncultured Jatrophihabitans sp. TaxID=1610747 RepID=UPI0035CA5902
MNLSLLSDMAADAYGGRALMGTRGASYSAIDIKLMSVVGAALLRERDASALIYLDVNGPAFPVALFAASRAGVPLVPLNYRLDRDRLADMIAKHPGSVAITSAAYAPLFATAGVPVFGTQEWLAATSVGQIGEEQPTDTGAPAVIIYTSGTTSEPKGVLLRHENLVSYVLGTVEFAGAEPADAALVSVPPYHVAAVANAITNLYAGRRCIVLENFTGPEWLELVRAEGVTNALVVPTMLARIMDSGEDLSVPSLRTLAYGGASMPQRVIERALLAWPHVGFVNAYGLTETSSTIAVLGPDDHRSAFASSEPHVRARLASAGQAVPTVQMQIRDEQGNERPPGEVGRIWVRGNQVSGEYAGLGSVLDDEGWFDTRDEGYLDEAGYLFVGGRTDDTIIRGGENVAPAQIEDVLLARADVGDAAVVGVPDEVWGQRIEAIVVPVSGRAVDPDEIRLELRRLLRSSLTPDRIHVWDALPRTETGKLVRRDVAQLLAERTQHAGAHD